MERKNDPNCKFKQLQIILENNPCEDNYHTWIRRLDDIKTLEEAIIDDPVYAPDYMLDHALHAIATNQITVYSSHPIELGTFVTPSRMEAETYSKDGTVYSKNIPLTDVAWISSIEGQYAPC